MSLVMAEPAATNRQISCLDEGLIDCFSEEAGSPSCVLSFLVLSFFFSM